VEPAYTQIMVHARVRSLIAGDNLEAMGRIATSSAGLVYLDPPFNSGRQYEAIVAPRAAGTRHRKGAFHDRWSWSDGMKQALSELEEFVPPRVAHFVGDVSRALDYNDLAAYLVMMTSRLGMAHRVLMEKGSLYLHCDPAASHYLKLILDQIFGAENFRNEIIWKRTHAHSSSRRFGPVHDVILFYSKSAQYVWNPLYSEYQSSYIEKHFTHEDENGRYQLITCTAPGDRTGTRAHYDWNGQYPPPGRHWAWKRDQMQMFEREGRLVYSSNGVPRLKRYTHDGLGVQIQDIWSDINRLDAHSDERVGYETQKPLALLERIISASTEPGDTVVDPFCGTGTTLVAAERLGRGWIGIDASLFAASISLARVRQEVHLKQVALSGFPQDEASAQRLLRYEPGTFGIWGASMLGTLADRKASNESMTAGTGKLCIDGKTFQLLSWVPTEDVPIGVLQAEGSRRLAKLGFVLKVGRSFEELTGWLAQRTKVPLYPVAIGELVDAKSRKRGLSERIVATAGTAT